MSAESFNVVRLALGVIFIWAAAGKLVNPIRFADGLADYTTLPTPALYILAATLISLELALGLSHATGQFLDGGIPLALATLIVFAVLVRRRLSQGRPGPCLCFGTTDDSELISSRTIARLGILIAGEVLLLGHIGSWTRENLSVAVASPETGTFSPMIIVWTTIILVLGTWVLRINEVLELFNIGYSGKTAPHLPEA